MGGFNSVCDSFLLGPPAEGVFRNIADKCDTSVIHKPLINQVAGA